MEDAQIIDHFFRRDPEAIRAAQEKYEKRCLAAARHILPAEDGAVRALEQQEFRRVLNGFLRKLTRQSRTYFIRRYWYGESIREIADSCGAGEEKVKSSLFRTRQRLRTVLEKEGML